MSPAFDLQAISKLCDVLNAKGVRSFKTDGFELVFNEPEDAEPAAPEPKPSVDPDLCRCGHFSHEHMNGLCLKDCAPEKCAGPEAK